MEKRQKANKKKTVLGLAEELWSPMGDTNYHRLNESTSNCKIPISKSAGDISLQCLDARALLNRGGQNHSIMSSSTPPSSLDLEWEHEGLPSPAPWQIISESEDFINLESTSQATQSIVQPQPRCSSEVTNLSGWSRISTPDSLEWDPIQPLNEESSDLAVNEFDTETEQLLSEIERLTRTALKETGIELDR